MIDIIQQVKNEVCRVAKKAQDEGMCKHKSGNFSQIIRDKGLVVITPSGVDRDDLSPRDMIVIDLDYNVIENISNLKPSSEVLVHIELYKKRPDINAVVHTHSKYATSFAVSSKEIPAIVYEVGLLSLKEGYVPLAPYERPGTFDLANSVAEKSLISDVILMESHGAVAVGNSLYDAYLKASYLEELAEVYFNALLISKNEPSVLPVRELNFWEYPKVIKFK